jgi:two-component system cell cycle sensor histidine kinase/response regulator CckA
MDVTTQNENQSYLRMQTLPATILPVEDEAAVREVTREALEMGGYHVLTADGAAGATHIAGDESTTIDLLLTDVIMPGTNDPELARQVKLLRPELATLFMIGYA